MNKEITEYKIEDKEVVKKIKAYFEKVHAYQSTIERLSQSSQTYNDQAWLLIHETVKDIIDIEEHAWEWSDATNTVIRIQARKNKLRDLIEERLRLKDLEEEAKQDE